MAIIIQGAGSGSTLRDLNGNSTQGTCSTVSGGQNNQTNSSHATVSGGLSNTANSNYSLVGGGACNRIYSTGVAINSNTIGGGWRNTVTGGLSNCSLVGGGACNTILTNEATIGGGVCNKIFDGNTNSSILGGKENLVAGPNSFYGTIGGGLSNTVFGQGSTIGGGMTNTSCSNSSIIGGGCKNTITKFTNNQAQTFGNFIGGGSCNTLDASVDCYSVIGGGFKTFNKGTLNFIGGGSCNTAISRVSTIVGGSLNRIQGTGCNSSIGGGMCNTISSNNGSSTIGGGCRNTITSLGSGTIAGGFGNTVIGDSSGVLGGCSNTVIGNCSFAVSVNSKVTGNNTVALGGSSINATVNNSVYVPKLNIRDLPNNVPVYGLGIDSNGFVVKSISPGINCVVDGILTEGLPTSLASQVPSISTTLLNGDLQLIGSSVLYDDYTNSFDTSTGIWTCPATGRWNIGYFTHMTGPDPLNGWLSTNGMIYAGIVNFTTNEVYAASTYYPTNIQLYADINGGQWGVQLTAGDQLCVRITNTTTQTYTPLIGGTDYVRFSAQKIG